MESRAVSQSRKTAADGFSISLGGLTTVASFAFTPAVDANRLNQVRDARPKGIRRRPKLVARVFAVVRRPAIRLKRARAA